MHLRRKKARSVTHQHVAQEEVVVAAAAVAVVETGTEEIFETEIETGNGIGNGTVEAIEDGMIGTVKAIDETTRTVLIGIGIEIGITIATDLTEEMAEGDLGRLTVMLSPIYIFFGPQVNARVMILCPGTQCVTMCLMF